MSYAIMSREAVRAAAKTLYGDAASDNEIKRNLSTAMAVTERCVGKWLYGERKMTGPAVVLLRLLVEIGSLAGADPKRRRRRRKPVISGRRR